MEEMRYWSRMPARWIVDGGLKNFRWRERGGVETAALILYMAFCHSCHDPEGRVRLTYEDAQRLTGWSKATISGALSRLKETGLIVSEGGRSVFSIADYAVSPGWAQLPFRGLYGRSQSIAFSELQLRHRNELNAVKAYLLIVARRNTKSNYAAVSYQTISRDTGIRTEDIRPAMTLLANLTLVHVDHAPSGQSDHGLSNRYRLAKLDSRNHMGTRGRQTIGAASAVGGSSFDAPISEVSFDDQVPTGQAG